jgi:hypothetical protein
LGNQLFIYATARRLALKNDVPLHLDVSSGFQRDSYRRQYLLDNFRIEAQVATSHDSFGSGLGFLRRRARQKVEQFSEWHHRSYIMEKKRDFDPRILDLEVKKKVYLDGLWQSERYFADIRPTLCRDLELISPRCPATRKTADEIHTVNAVSLHGRSYREVPAADKAGVAALAMDYYRNAAAYVARRVANPHFFCFSDDLAWLRGQLKIDFPVTFVDRDLTTEGDSTLDDFWLMRQCRHHIVADSTYSWWSAWLSENPGKMVIAPHCDWQNPDYLPPHWIVLPGHAR